MTYRIHELETGCTYDDIYNTIGEAKAQIAEYYADDNDETDPRASMVTYVIIDENDEYVAFAD